MILACGVPYVWFLHKETKRITAQNIKIIQELKRRRQFAELPPAYRPENWWRNVHGDPTDESFVLASTGCELTDAIYAAAHRAKIDIVEFENNSNTKERSQ